MHSCILLNTEIFRKEKKNNFFDKLLQYGQLYIYIYNIYHSAKYENATNYKMIETDFFFFNKEYLLDNILSFENSRYL